MSFADKSARAVLTKNFLLFTDVTRLFQKSGSHDFSASYRRKPKSGIFRMFRIPAFAGMTVMRNISYSYTTVSGSSARQENLRSAKIMMMIQFQNRQGIFQRLTFLSLSKLIDKSIGVCMLAGRDSRIKSRDHHTDTCQPAFPVFFYKNQFAKIYTKNSGWHITQFPGRQKHFRDALPCIPEKITCITVTSCIPSYGMKYVRSASGQR